MSSTAVVRRPRWHPPPPPTPKILNLPRRTRRKPAKLTGKPSSSSSRGKLESLFDQERVFSRTIPIVLLNSSTDQRRERVEDYEFRKQREDEEDEDKWRFQAEILRAECNFLRMERDIALKKLELNRVQTKRTLRSAVETLVSGKEKIYKGKSVSSVLEEEIEDLEEELQRSSCGVGDFEFGKSSNFDKQASVLEKRLQKLGEGLVSEEKCAKEIREMAEASLTIKTCRNLDRFKDVEVLRRKMEKLSKGMLERMEEEYGAMISSSSTSSATSSTSNSRRIEYVGSSSTQVQSFLRHKEEESKSNEGSSKACRGRCKKIVRKIVEQVRAEMEQWEQMQEMLERVRKEMEEFETSRDFWQDRALHSDHSLQEWQQKARYSEIKVTELEKHINELGRLKEEEKKKLTRIPLKEREKEKEKRVLICRLKENHQGSCSAKKNIARDSCEDISRKRSPLQDIQNRNRVPYAMP